jgi:dCMP deaminase
MRKRWYEYFMDIAFAVSTRSTCKKRQVGAVIVHEKRILATGYNGSLPGTRHCDEVGCLLNGKGNCIRTIHAEANAIARLREQGSEIYCTDQPCINCLKLILATGIENIYYRRTYESEDLQLFMNELRSGAVGFSGLRRIYQVSEQGVVKLDFTKE